MPKKKVMVAFGTRPEAIKMAPVIRALKNAQGIEPLVLVTGQHRQMLDQVLDLFHIVPDDDLNLMQADQSLPDLFGRLLTGVADVIAHRRPDLVLVHGDTSTTLASGLAAFYSRTPLGHVEAGLRTQNMQAPWPEEMNRRLTAPLAQLHFAPSTHARDNLLREGVSSRTIHVTGNTVVDALSSIVETIHCSPDLQRSLAGRFPFLNPRKRLVLVTGHRRENFGSGIEAICQAILDISGQGDVQVVYPVHLNPNVREPVERILRGTPDVHLIPPQDYVPFVYLMSRADLIITDSGGIQEEAPSLGKPLLLLRETTERPEVVNAGAARLVGTDRNMILTEALSLLEESRSSTPCTIAANPYGDGQAAVRILDVLAEHFGS